MDLVILVVILAIVVVAFKKFDNFLYVTIFIDLFLRILTQIKDMLGIAEISNFIGQYIPASIPAIFAKYSSGIFFTVLLWGYVILYIIFEVYIFKTFLKKK